MLEYLAGDIAGNGEITTELAFKGGLYMSELHVAMQVGLSKFFITSIFGIYI